MNIYHVIREPLVTEKGTKQEKNRKYYFRVDKHSNKHEIREAVERLFNVKVTKVNTMRMSGKRKRMRFRAGLTPEWKKAAVTLKEGQKIALA
ncbi:MAG: 50S ribosomal protein L23 [Omnitrophica bacterium RIFCSPLOWO2_12_FULL_50_11]|nr:MAG: 50S ribosomal protein L23 [Omnitrophica bacterium RIFCSPLOWO2_12_FULL_50_11]